MASDPSAIAPTTPSLSSYLVRQVRRFRGKERDLPVIAWRE
jgi:hypothetical protein